MKLMIQGCRYIGVLLSLAILVTGCSSNEFSSQSARSDGKSKPFNPGDAIQGPNQPTDSIDSLVPDAGGLVARPDYAQCLTLPSGGYAQLGKCGLNEVMVMINDGNAGGRSCCPIGAGVLSVNPGEVNQRRSRSCQANEVSTGIENMQTPLCTKINENVLKLSAPVTAIHGTSGSAAELAKLAAGYHNNDLCACPAGTVIVGGIPSADNSCSSIQCARIEKK